MRYIDIVLWLTKMGREVMVISEPIRTRMCMLSILGRLFVLIIKNCICNGTVFFFLFYDRRNFKLSRRVVCCSRCRNCVYSKGSVTRTHRQPLCPAVNHPTAFKNGLAARFIETFLPLRSGHARVTELFAQIIRYIYSKWFLYFGILVFLVFALQFRLSK